MENDDENVGELQEAEERLYAQVYHDNSIEMEAQTTNFPNSSIVSSNKPNVRYWQNSKQNTSAPKQQQKFAKKHNFQKFQKQPPKPNDDIENEVKNNESTEAAKKFFVPYSSVLTFMAPPEVVERPDDVDSAATNYEKKSKTMKFPKDKKPDRVVHKQLVKAKYAAKVEKAEKVRQKQAKKKPVDSISIESSSEDEVVLVPLKPPPIINLDSSEDEGIIKKKKRAASPSSSSMISDDFIVLGDRARLSNPPTILELHTNEVNDRLMEVLSEKEKMKKIKTLTKVSSSSSNSARSSCERNISNEKTSRDKVKSKRKVQIDSPEATIDTVYSSKAKITKKKKQQSESSDDDGIVQKPSKSHKKRRKSSGSRKKSTDDKSDEEDKDPKLEMISKAQKKKKSSESVSKKVVEVPLEIIEEPQVEQQQESEVEIILQPPEPIYEITDDEDENDRDSDDSMRNFKTNVECDLSLNVTECTSKPHELDFKPENFKRQLFLQGLDCEVGWNDEMKFFYNECSYGRDFSLSSIQAAMPQHPKYWPVNHADRVRMYSEHDKRIRCRNCNEMGHIAVNCKRPKKRVVCYMCGESGHRETRCPRAICLRCGKPNRVFVQVCSSCYTASRKICPICNYKGHSMEDCPDKWRRYHSTTSPDHGNELEIAINVNPRVFCSICAKKGHFADECSQFNKAMAGLVTSSPIAILSNKSSYTKGTSFNEPIHNEHVLQLTTYMDTYKFNFNLPSNCQLYPHFKELFKNQQREIFMQLQVMQAVPRKKRKRSRKSRKNKAIEGNNEGTSNRITHHDDSNSNYSFSEFYIDKGSKTNDENENQKALVPALPSAAEFIPLQDARIIENRIPSPIVKLPDARIMLTKSHASVLMTPKGQNLVYDLGVRFNITSQFNWDSTGNSLVIQGSSRNQENFHCEIRNYLYQFEIEEYTKTLEKSTQAPKIRSHVVNYLQNNLNLIKKPSIKETRKTLQSLIGAEKERDHKKTIKFRKSLNIIFMGYTELGEGSFHLGELRKILFQQKQEVENGKGSIIIDQNLRDEINQHIRYIFSAINHGNYRELFEAFQKIIHERDEKKLVINPILRR